MPSISDRLKALGVQVGSENLPVSPVLRSYTVERVFDGRLFPTSVGDAYAIEEYFSNDYAQGIIPIQIQHPFDGIAAWLQDDRMRGIDQDQIAFLDTETTGLMGGTGTYAFLIGVGRFVGDQFYLAQFFMRDPIEEPRQLAALEEFLAPCSALVTFNGKSFDVPLLVTRYLLHDWQPPFKQQIQIDLLHLARCLWRLRLPSRTLTSLEFNILKATRTEDDIPGWMIPQLYFDYLRSGDARPLKRVFYHNAMDVLSMAALLNVSAGLLGKPLEAQLEHGEDWISLAWLYEKQGNVDLAEQLYLHGLDAEIPEEIRLDAIVRLGFLYKRQGKLQSAVRLWEMATQASHLLSHIELAKYFEHGQRDYDLALIWTQKALSLLNNLTLSQYEKRALHDELEHRLKRLQRKSNA